MKPHVFPLKFNQIWRIFKKDSIPIEPQDFLDNPSPPSISVIGINHVPNLKILRTSIRWQRPQVIQINMLPQWLKSIFGYKTPVLNQNFSPLLRGSRGTQVLHHKGFEPSPPKPFFVTTNFNLGSLREKLSRGINRVH
ncbi:hypothetical protein F8388_010084 [Cannabis sativa]|uniref:Uncharacterized protein n=1 Tax=Cannabis sativa TaxID=3483 RepID=A0A7J6FZ15_CANSA|nr:hypothetical protein G4B88_029309 [Cannabis sativa]KAF4385528.1 hypothetical protein F8388_010084 [Cannabis sativa]